MYPVSKNHLYYHYYPTADAAAQYMQRFGMYGPMIMAQTPSTPWLWRPDNCQLEIFKEWRSYTIAYLLTCFDGCNVRRLLGAVKDHTGEDVPLQKMGLPTVYHFLYEMSDFVEIRRVVAFSGQSMLHVHVRESAIPDDSKHLREMVLEQRKPKDEFGRKIKPKGGEYVPPRQLLWEAEKSQRSMYYNAQTQNGFPYLNYFPVLPCSTRPNPYNSSILGPAPLMQIPFPSAPMPMQFPVWPPPGSFPPDPFHNTTQSSNPFPNSFMPTTSVSNSAEPRTDLGSLRASSNESSKNLGIEKVSNQYADDSTKTRVPEIKEACAENLRVQVGSKNFTADDAVLEKLSNKVGSVCDEVDNAVFHSVEAPLHDKVKDKSSKVINSYASSYATDPARKQMKSECKKSSNINMTNVNLIPRLSDTPKSDSAVTSNLEIQREITSEKFPRTTSTSYSDRITSTSSSDYDKTNTAYAQSTIHLRGKQVVKPKAKTGGDLGGKIPLGINNFCPPRDADGYDSVPKFEKKQPKSRSTQDILDELELNFKIDFNVNVGYSLETDFGHEHVRLIDFELPKLPKYLLDKGYK